MHVLLKQVKLNTFYNNLYLQNVFGKGYSDLQPNIFCNTF